MIDLEKARALEREFKEAAAKFADVPVTYTLPVGTLLMIASTLQVGLRCSELSDLPLGTRRAVKQWIGGVEVALSQLAPVFGEIIRMGADPRHEKPSTEEVG